MSDPIIIVEDVTKSYGKKIALHSISVKIHAGEILGLFGPNGAGKSVLIRLLATLEKPDAGRITMCGFDLLKKSDRIRSSIGLVSDILRLEEELTVTDHLEFLLSVYSVKKEQRSVIMEYLLERSGLLKAKDCQIKCLSAGFKQRLRLASIFLPHFKLLLLDEPFKDLDIWIRGKIIKQIRELASQGKAVLLASHFLEELKNISHRLVVIREGRFENIIPPDFER